ncbi:unnamed protein product, partial [Scytosiphon promiscuus]
FFSETSAHLAYYLGLLDDAEHSIGRALELGHQDDGSLQMRLARIHVRRHKSDSANAQTHLHSALLSFSEAMKFEAVASKAVHYLEVTSVYLKLNETQRAANALSTILVRWPALMVDPAPVGHSAPLIEGDDAEVDLPLASNVLGSESVFLQMGLCFEALHKDEMAAEAYHQAWNTLLERRAAAAEREPSGAEAPNTTGTGGHNDGIADGGGDDAVRRILSQARLVLQNCSRSTAAVTAGGWSRGSTPGQGVLRRPREKGPLIRRKPTELWLLRCRQYPSVRHGPPSLEALPGKTGGGAEGQRGVGGTAVTYKDAVLEETRARALGFELWSKDPYTWYRLGEVVLGGGCHALALSFLAKAVALLPPGLQQQEKGRFSDAHSAAEEARDLDPFGKAVRLRCPRLMALHSEDARSQAREFRPRYSSTFTRESLSAVRVQRAWRGHRVVRVFRDLVSRQVAALRIQRFMREWRRSNVCLALRFVAASALELRQAPLSAPHAKAMGLTTKAAAADRLAALVSSAISVQRAARTLIARRRVFRRRLAIAAFQAFFRGCRARWALSEVLESSTRVASSCDVTRQRQDVEGGDEGCGMEGGMSHGFDLDYEHDTCKGGGIVGGNTGAGEELGDSTSMHIGVVTRRDVPMDAGYPQGFGPPNLAAFLWESREDAYGPGFHAGGGESEAPLPDLHSENETHNRPCSPLSEKSVRGSGCSNSCSDRHGGEADEDGAIFEVSAVAVMLSSTTMHGQADHQGKPRKAAEPVCTHPGIDHGGRPPAFGEPCLSTVAATPRRRIRWAPATVAPEEALRCALTCSTLVVDSPSFGSASARRLFSRIGKALPVVSPATAPTNQPVPPAPTTEAKTTTSTHGEPGRTPVSPMHMEVARAGSGRNSRGRRQADGIEHVLLLGQSPIGDGGLSQLSSAVRCGWLPRLTTLVIGGQGCRVGPRGVTCLAVALSSPGCSQLRSLSMSHCCLGRRRRPNRLQCKNYYRYYHDHQLQRSNGPLLHPAPAQKTATEAHASWDCFFRHLQRLPSLSTLSVQDCGLHDRDVRSLSIALQILPSGCLRSLRLSGNSVGVFGLRMLLTALTSRRMRLPALWLRGQRPPLAESGARRIIEDAFRDDGLFAEVEFERPFEVMGGRSRLRLVERTTESEDLGSRVHKHPTSKIYV